MVFGSNISIYKIVFMAELLIAESLFFFKAHVKKEFLASVNAFAYRLLYRRVLLSRKRKAQFAVLRFVHVLFPVRADFRLFVLYIRRKARRFDILLDSRVLHATRRVSVLQYSCLLNGNKRQHRTRHLR